MATVEVVFVGGTFLIILALIIAIIPFFLIKEKRNKIFYGLAFIEGIILSMLLATYLATLL
jgi:hypothetical protein